MIRHGLWKQYSFTLACLLILGGLLGCELFDSEEEFTPTTPLSADQLANYWSNPVEDDSIGAYVRGKGGVFALQVPTGGIYRLSYTVEHPETDASQQSAAGSSLHDYHLVFEAEHGASTCVGLSGGDRLAEAVLEQGTLEGQTPLHTDGNISLYAWPYEWNGWQADDPHPTDMALSTILNTQAIVENGGVATTIEVIENPCVVLAPTPTPKPTPNPATASSKKYTITVSVGRYKDCGGTVTPPGVTVSQDGDSQTGTFEHNGGQVTFTMDQDDSNPSSCSIYWGVEDPTGTGSGGWQFIGNSGLDREEYTRAVTSNFTFTVDFVGPPPGE